MLLGCGTSTTNPGDDYFEDGDFEQAASAYTASLSSDPENVQLLYNRGRSFEELGKFDEAIADFKKIVQIDPHHINSFLSLSKIAYSEKKYSEALLQASLAIKENENSANAHFLSARAAHQLGYADQALEYYNNAISIDRSYGEAYLYRGALKVGRKRLKGACEDFKRAQSLDVEGADSAIKDYCR